MLVAWGSLTHGRSRTVVVPTESSPGQSCEWGCLAWLPWITPVPFLSFPPCWLLGVAHVKRGVRRLSLLVYILPEDDASTGAALGASLQQPLVIQFPIFLAPCWLLGLVHVERGVRRPSLLVYILPEDDASTGAASRGLLGHPSHLEPPYPPMHRISSAWEPNHVRAMLVFMCAPNVWGLASLSVSVVLAGTSARGVAVRWVLLWPFARNGCVSGVFVVRVGRLLARATNCRPSRRLSPSRDV